MHNSSRRDKGQLKAKKLKTVFIQHTVNKITRKHRKQHQRDLSPLTLLPGSTTRRESKKNNSTTAEFMRSVSDIHITRGSVATCFRCGGIRIHIRIFV